MKNILLALIISMVSLSALACGGNNDEEDKKRFEVPVSSQR